MKIFAMVANWSVSAFPPAELYWEKCNSERCFKMLIGAKFVALECLDKIARRIGKPVLQQR